jgi:hypothetical protein
VILISRIKHRVGQIQQEERKRRLKKKKGLGVSISQTLYYIQEAKRRPRYAQNSCHFAEEVEGSHDKICIAKPYMFLAF